MTEATEERRWCLGCVAYDGVGRWLRNDEPTCWRCYFRTHYKAGREKHLERERVLDQARRLRLRL
jgi:hypothetical protein